MTKLQLPIGVFNKGAVIYVEYTFDDNSGEHKRRPAVVIDFDNDNTRVMLLKVTTHAPRTIYDYTLSDPNVANLKAGSVVRCNNIMTISNQFTCEKHGDLSRRDEIAVENFYRKALADNQMIIVQ